MSLDINLLGSFTIAVDGVPLATVIKPRLQQLIAYLVLHRDTPQPRDRLAFLLWSDSTEAQARTNFRNLVHLLRRALPRADSYLHLDGPVVQWREETDLAFDVAYFQAYLAAASEGERKGSSAEAIGALQNAVDLYRGDLLPDTYEDWVLPEREALREQYLSALERLVLLLEGQGNYLTATGYAQRLLRQDPLRETTYRHLMRLYHAAGDDPAAIRIYRTCETVLDREFGVEPGHATQELYREIASQTPLPPGRQDIQNNLPAQSTIFIGRERDLVALAGSLREETVRLVTLTGTGGSGKTRLALQAASELLNNFSDGIYFVSLAPVTEASMVPSAIAGVLDVRESAGSSVLESLQVRLHSKSVLLLLDNFEQVLGAAPVVEALLRCPGVKVLVTSRVPLGLQGETIHALSPLDLPNARGSMLPEIVAQYDSVALFVERATDEKRDFALTPQNAPYVAEICTRLDGLPLAIELAAARVRLLPPREMLARLEAAQGRLRVLAGRDREGPQRHETMRSAISWSYDLLEPPEQTLFRRLGVFAGGSTLDAVEQVCSSAGTLPIETLDGLESLVRKSLLKLDERGEAAPRFSMLETIREYAWELLQDHGERAALQGAHAAYYQSYAAAPPEESAKAGWERLDAEHDNLRAATRWALDSHSSALALRLCLSLRRFWAERGHLTEGRRWFAEALEQREAAEPALLLEALDGAADLAYYQGDNRAAAALYEELVALARSTGDKHREALALWGFAELARDQADYPVARLQVEESLALLRELDDRGAYTRVLNTLGNLLLVQGEYDGACEVYGEVLALCRELGIFAAIPTGNLAEAEHGRGNWLRAEELFTEALALLRERGHVDGTAWLLSNLGQTALLSGNIDRAEELQTESLALQERMGDKQGLMWVYSRQAQITFLRGNLDQARALLLRSLQLCDELGSRRGMVLNLLGLAALEGETGNPERAAFIAGGAEALLAAISGRLQTGDRLLYDRILDQVRKRLGEGAWQRAWSEGQGMSPEELLALHFPPSLDSAGSPPKIGSSHIDL